MRIVHIDIDTLRPDHLGCYGYHRNTSPNIDRLAAEGVRFDNCYVSDSPCLPSRAALYSGTCGIRNGAVNHGGLAADPWIDPADRNFRTLQDNFVVQLRRAGLYPVSVSPFGERHSAFWFYNGFREMFNTGKGGGERADEVMPAALDWLQRRGREQNWYLHVNLWDPHTGYRTPEHIGNPFANDPPPAWMTEEIRRKTWNTYGPGCAQEPGGDYLMRARHGLPRMPRQIDSMASYRQWIDGYDVGIYYADLHVGQLLDKLEQLGVLDDTLIFVSSDHGENQGELCVFGDHQTADHVTHRVPLIVRHPAGRGGRGRADPGLVYQFDWAATLIDLVGGTVPASWDGRSFLADFDAQRTTGRDALVLGNCTWSCQRSARWDDYLLVRTYHAGFKNYPGRMLFNVAEDPHELDDLAARRPELVDHGLALIEQWQADEMRRSRRDVDPMQTVLREGGPFHACFTSPNFAAYRQRLVDTGRAAMAEDLDRHKRRWEGHAE
jgi:arylsulfatase A-like enzyme